MAEKVTTETAGSIWKLHVAEGDAVEVTDAYTRAISNARETAAAEHRGKLH